MAIIWAIYLVIFIVIFITFMIKYALIKQYFWATLNDYDKKYVNYMMHKNNVIKNHYPKKYYIFIEERNKVLIQYNKTQAEKFIKYENTLCKLEIINIYCCIILVTINVFYACLK